jgi:hypothetical protein
MTIPADCATHYVQIIQFLKVTMLTSSPASTAQLAEAFAFTGSGYTLPKEERHYA